MTASSEPRSAGMWNYWRAARWTGVSALLLTPLAMMQLSDAWHWTFGSFVAAAIVLGGAGLLYELAEKISKSRRYRAGAAIALITCLLTVWTTIVRDDGNGVGFLMLVMTVAVGGFSAWFGAAGMARTMLGVAIMQVLLGLAIATAPSIASNPDAAARTLAFGGFFTGLWLIAAIFFRGAAKAEARSSAGDR